MKAVGIHFYRQSFEWTIAGDLLHQTMGRGTFKITPRVHRKCSAATESGTNRDTIVWRRALGRRGGGGRRVALPMCHQVCFFSQHHQQFGCPTYCTKWHGRWFWRQGPGHPIEGKFCMWWTTHVWPWTWNDMTWHDMTCHDMDMTRHNITWRWHGDDMEVNWDDVGMKWKWHDPKSKLNDMGMTWHGHDVTWHDMTTGDVKWHDKHTTWTCTGHD